MKTILADYNAATELGHLRLNCNASREAIAKAQVLLRLGRPEAARDAMSLARSVDSIFPEIGEALGLTVYNERARDLAERARVRARPIAE